jgi:spermidine synthase
VVRVLEPPGADRRALLRRLKAGTYDKAFVADDGTTRTLHFSKDYLQSSMRLDDPYALEFGYTRKIMAFLLFLPRPRNVLMLGLGGGSLAKFCHRQLPETRITVVESDATVLGLRDQFLIPPDDERFRVVLDEGAAYLRRATGDFDAILVDAFDKDGCAPTICSPQFYVAAHGALAREGLMVSNIVGAKAHRLDHLDIIRTAFDDNVILLPVVGDGNHLAFAFRDPAFEPRWKWIAKEAKAMKGRYGLDFPKFAEKLERSRKMGYVRRHSSQAAFSE